MAEETPIVPTTEPPAANTPEARTPDGTILDLATPTPEPSSEPEPKEPAPAVPETYADFTAPEGLALDPKIIEQAAPIFKELGLTQAQAQKLIDLGISRQQAATQAYTDMRAQWADETRKDPEIGGKLPEVLAEIGKMYDAFGGRNDPLIKSFIQRMDLTGAGDSLSFVKLFYKMAQKVNEGRHVSGAGPTAEGQRPNGKVEKPSAAQSMYPNLA